jgi:hypothetical protein
MPCQSEGEEPTEADTPIADGFIADDHAARPQDQPQKDVSCLSD